MIESSIFEINLIFKDEYEYANHINNKIYVKTTTFSFLFHFFVVLLNINAFRLYVVVVSKF